MKNILLEVGTLFISLFFMGPASALDVQITPDIASVDVMHNGKKVTIMRNKNTSNTINFDYAKTPCKNRHGRDV
ncbi:MAG: hypothetical protein ACI8PW_000314 [Methylophilaceae bacterium]|jgi:hypothetical protein